MAGAFANDQRQGADRPARPQADRRRALHRALPRRVGRRAPHQRGADAAERQGGEPVSARPPPRNASIFYDQDRRRPSSVSARSTKHCVLEAPTAAADAASAATTRGTAAAAPMHRQAPCAAGGAVAAPASRRTRSAPLASAAAAASAIAAANATRRRRDRATPQDRARPHAAQRAVTAADASHGRCLQRRTTAAPVAPVVRELWGVRQRHADRRRRQRSRPGADNARTDAPAHQRQRPLARR